MQATSDGNCNCNFSVNKIINAVRFQLGRGRATTGGGLGLAQCQLCSQSLSKKSDTWVKWVQRKLRCPNWGVKWAVRVRGAWPALFTVDITISEMNARICVAFVASTIKDIIWLSSQKQLMTIANLLYLNWRENKKKTFNAKLFRYFIHSFFIIYCASL